jgi:putative transcriptional regulator
MEIKMKSVDYVGKVLLASKEMSKQPQNPFAHTAILIAKHSPHGAFGLCFNRPGEEPVGALYERYAENEDWRGEAANPEQKLYMGGPCGSDVFTLHTNEEFGDIMVLPGIWFSARDGNVEESFRHDGQRKIIIGYAGWAPGQLEDEIEHGSWSVVDGKPEIIFSQDDQVSIWERANKKKATDFFSTVMGQDVSGINAELN